MVMQWIDLKVLSMISYSRNIFYEIANINFRVFMKLSQ